MNSTSREDKERLAREFYIHRLLPVSRAVADGGIHYFERGADPALETYFIRRSRTRWTAADFAAQSPGTPEQLADALSAFWTRTGNPELAALASDFAALAKQVYDVDAETAGVTPFMYVMF